MKHILMIATGGTIASKSTEAGLAPRLTSDDILHYIPQVRGVCAVDALQLCNLDSTNIGPGHWLKMAEAIEREYAKYDGFVICHGTDTMAYTAAALSYLIQGSPKPVVLTGSQKPIDMEITDAKTNLFDSFLYAAQETACGVQIVFGGKAIAGTRARKCRTKSYNAFSSINFPNLALIQDGRIMRYIRQECGKEPFFSHGLNTRVALLKLIPGIRPDFLDYLFEKNDAVIIESYGVGGIPSADGCDFHEVIGRWVKEGKTVVMTTQVPNEGSDMTVYRVGHKLKEKYGVLEAYDMTTEALVTKLMWILGQTRETDKIRALFYQTINFDILYKEE